MHVPYAVILIKACQKWRDEHNGNMPANFQEKTEFTGMIKTMCRFTDVFCENFDEAIAVATECFKKQEALPSNIEILFAQFENEMNNSSKAFGVMARALQQFYKQENRLPVQGTIPDMISLPEFYLTL